MLLYWVSHCWKHYTKLCYIVYDDAEYHYAEYHYAEYNYAEYHYAEYHYAEYHYAEYFYTKHNNSECYYAKSNKAD